MSHLGTASKRKGYMCMGGVNNVYRRKTSHMAEGFSVGYTF